MQEIDFWYQCIGRYLAPDTDPSSSTKVGVMSRLKKGVAMNTLGAGVDAFYIAHKQKSYLIGKIEMASLPALEFIPSEDVSGERFIAHWLVEQAPSNDTWMIGVIGNAKPNESMKRSHPLALCRFCRSGASLDFDLGVVRQAVSIIGNKLDWKKDVAPALHAIDARHQASSIGDDDKVERENLKLLKSFKNTPGLKEAILDLCRLPLKPHSGEYEIVSWYNRAR